MPSSGIHCSTEKRGWTELSTNLTLLSGIDLSTHFADLVQFGKFPQSSWPAFIHELTHHWCFQSSVGNALSLLYHRARNQAISIAAHADSLEDKRFEVVEDMSRYELAVSLLRPLAEGLALFSEFDLIPDKNSRVVSIPMHWIGLAFTLPSPKEIKEEFGFSTYVAVARMRTSRLYQERKAAFFLEPLDCQDGGYLAGYLTVKNMWLALMRQNTRFESSDFFLTFVRSFFYDDLGLVAHLLDSTLSEINACNAIAEYIQNRLNALFIVNVDECAKAFEDQIASLTIGQRILRLEPMLTSTDLADKGEAYLQDELNKLNSESLDDSIRSSFNTATLWTLAQRDMMCLASMSAIIEVHEEGRLLISDRGKPLMIGQALQNVSPRNGECTLELYISPSAFWKAIVVSQEQKIVFMHVLSVTDLPPGMTDQIARYQVNRDENAKLNELFGEFMERTVAKGAASVVMEHIREYTASAPDNVYRPKALLQVKAELENAVSKLMQNDGFAALLQNDEKNVTALAALTLVTSLDNRKSEVKSILRRANVEFEEVLALCARVEQQYGFKLIRTSSKGIMSSV